MQEKYYSKLSEMPLINFQECLNGNYGHIKKRETETYTVSDFKAWLLIYDLFLQKYDGKNLNTKYNILKSLLSLKAAYIESGDPFLLTQIKIKESELPLVQEKNQEIDFIENLVELSKFMGYRLDIKTETVDTYFAIIKRYERENKKK